MATRQYIGARYVPKFFDFDGSPEWRNGVAYEALTIVTRNGNSYTSKIPVPSNIGAPESNPEYWVSTGLFNEQVEQYRKETENIKTNLNAEVTARKEADTKLTQDLQNEISAREAADATKVNKDSASGMIVISDSYGVNSVVGDNSWVDIVERETEHSEFYRSTHGSRGFVPNNIVAESFLDSLNEITVTNPDHIKTIIVCGGSNDANQEVSVIDDAIKTFITTAKQKYKNATVYIGMIGYSRHPENLYLHSLPAYEYAPYYGGVYLNGVENALRLTMLQSDGVHPTATGSREIANAVINAFKTGYYSVNRHNTAITYSPSGIVTEVVDAPIFIENQHNDSTTLVMASSDYDASITLKTNKTTWSKKEVLEIGTITGNLSATGRVAHGIGTLAKMYLRGGTYMAPIAGSNMTCSVYLGEGNKIYLIPLGNPTSSSFWGDNFNDVTHVVISSDVLINNGSSFCN